MIARLSVDEVLAEARRMAVDYGVDTGDSQLRPMTERYLRHRYARVVPVGFWYGFDDRRVAHLIEVAADRLAKARREEQRKRYEASQRAPRIVSGGLPSLGRRSR